MDDVPVVRDDWRALRKKMEATGRRYTRTGERSRHFLPKVTCNLLEPAIALMGLRSRAYANVRALEVSSVELEVPLLPTTFDGYRILHISDLHVGYVPDVLRRAAESIAQIDADLAVLTGDVQTWGKPNAREAVSQAAPLLDAIRLRDGTIGILGNHDTHDLADHLERRGVRMLINEHTTIRRNGARLHLTGTDDVHFFYTDAAAKILRQRRKGCAIAFVHSPEMADIAESAGYSLYLCGHTHGGQICWPNKKPIFSGVDFYPEFSRGCWTHGKMIGYTSRGVGASHRVRFNCPPEITVLTLRAPRVSRPIGISR